MASVIGTSSSNSNRSMHGYTSIAKASDLTYVRDVYRYQELYIQVIQILNSYISYFSTGDFEGLKHNYDATTKSELQLYLQNTTNFYNQTIEELVNFTYDPNMFIRYRNTTFKMLDGLMQSITLYNKYQQANLEIKNMSDILSSRDNILKYLEQNSQLTAIAFSTSQDVNLSLVLKPWYEQYLIKYGPPNDGVFQTNLLADIAANLIDQGIITHEQFVQDRYP